jgi:hypothetical protein
MKESYEKDMISIEKNQMWKLIDLSKEKKVVGLK